MAAHALPLPPAFPLLFAIALVATGPVAAASKVLFFDGTHIEATTGDVRLTLHRPAKLGRVLAPTEPWETYAVLAYNTVLKVDAGDFRLYYDCASAKPRTPGGVPEFAARFTCLAVSSDGVAWTKPNLGLAEFDNSTANNIVWPLSNAKEVYRAWEPGAVFIDAHPNVPDAERFKMLGTWEGPSGERGTYVFGSRDGLAFAPLFDAPSLTKSDTMNVAWYDTTLRRYVAFVRIDSPTPVESNITCPAGATVRRIGRCEFDALDAWGCSNTNATEVFTFDGQDPPCVDVYTNSAVLYGGRLLLFPAMYSHMTFATKLPNDGLLDVRFVFAPNVSSPAAYPPTWDARRPFVSTGVNWCRALVPAVYDVPRACAHVRGRRDQGLHVV